MRAFRIINRAVSLSIILLLALPLPGMAQGEGAAVPSASFSKERLAQMLAPVALFPDALLSQILMASTYPLEIVEADRWVKRNSGLKGDALDEALVNEEWDPSVKSLCHFPSILGVMSENIAQTTRLGDAFLAQQNDVMDMVQELRAQAREEGNLKSTEEQNVLFEQGTIIIKSASPEVIYVPSYDPFSVYGPWWYPAYPPYYWWPAPVIYSPGISFWPGFFVGLSIGSWSYFDWQYHAIYRDWHKTRRFHRHHDKDGTDRWQHDAEHRRGVAYRNVDTAKKFGQAPERSGEVRRDLRGFPERRTIDRQPRDSMQKDIERAPRTGGAADRRESGRARERSDLRERPVAPQRENVFDGGGDVRRERIESERGRTSRENISRGSHEGAGQVPKISRDQGSGRSQGSGKSQSSGQVGRDGVDGRMKR